MPASYRGEMTRSPLSHRLVGLSVLALSALTLSVVAAPTALGASGHAPSHADDRSRPPNSRSLPKVPVMTGSGGAVASVDRDASQVGIDVLARGGNAADAASPRRPP